MNARESELKDIFERMNKEASWCRTCMKRNTCKIKETVAIEQRMVSPYAVKHVKVTVQCRDYMKDCRLPGSPDILESLFIV